MLELFPACRPDHRKSPQLSVRRLWRRCCKWAKKVIAFNRAALEPCPPDNRYRTKTPYNLVDNVKERFLRLSANADLNELIAVHRSELDLRPVGHSKRSYPPHAPALFLCHWHRKPVNISDLEGAIARGQAVLELRSSGHCHHALAFYNLALHPRQRFMKLGANTDLDGAVALPRSALVIYRLSSRPKKVWAAVDLDGLISFPRAVLDLQSQGYPGHAISFRTFLRYLQNRLRRPDMTENLDKCISPELKSLCKFNVRKEFQTVGEITGLEEKITLRPTILDFHLPGCPIHVRKLVKGTVNSALESLPPRLLNTHTGVLCDKVALRSAFLNSQQYKRLLSSVTTCSTTLRDNIHNTVSTYFEYVTLSHRWDKDDPLLCRIQGRTIYHMDPTKVKGLLKLQTFCATALHCGYLWAWSDTCCVDKDNNVKPTKAMESMFSWYRRSALTIVYLFDVSRDGKLSSSTWFKRGWTLQELLAPRKILFYTQDWSLYKGSPSSNHKEDDVVLTELEAATGIARHYLTDFNPGFDNARSRLQWASGRQTTEPEDLAYSLFGIFNADLSFSPGESAENALGRLLTEIISKSGDLSVLDWVGEASSYHSCFPARIASYGSLPPTYSKNEPRTPLPNTPELVEARVKLLNSLSTLEHPRFIGRQLRLPCIVYQITAVELKAMDTKTPEYVYNIRAEGLLPFKIALSYELKDTSRPILPFVLIRLWHSKPLPSFIEAGVSDKLDARLTQPFSALLLEEQSGNYYKRIASSSVIVACSADVTTSAFKGEPQTITVL